MKTRKEKRKKEWGKGRKQLEVNSLLLPGWLIPQSIDSLQSSVSQQLTCRESFCLLFHAFIKISELRALRTTFTSHSFSYLVKVSLT